MSDMYAKFNKEVTNFGNLFKKSKTKSAQSLKPKIKSVQSEPLKKGNHYSKPPSRQIKSEPLRSRPETAPHLRKKEEKKIKWTQIIILVLILTAVSVIIYFIVDGFKKKCPDPNRPVYSKEYLDCIPRCDPDTEVYDRNVDDCIPAQLCEPPLVAHFCPGVEESCAGVKGCRCREPCKLPFTYNCDADDCICEPPLEVCGDTCCPENLCIENNGYYSCCPEEQVYYPDGPHEAHQCCGSEQIANPNKDGCITTCNSLSDIYYPEPDEELYPIPDQYTGELACDPNTTCVVIEKDADPMTVSGIIEYVEGIDDQDTTTFRANYVKIDDEIRLEIRFCKNNNTCIFKNPSYYPAGIRNNYFFYNSNSIWDPDENNEDTTRLNLQQMSEMSKDEITKKINDNFENTLESVYGRYCEGETSYPYGRRVVYDKSDATPADACDWRDCFYISQLEGTNKVYWNPAYNRCVANQVPTYGAGQTTYCYGEGDPCPSCKYKGQYVACVICQDPGIPCDNCEYQGQFIPNADCIRSEYLFGDCSTTACPSNIDGFQCVETEIVPLGECGRNSYTPNASSPNCYCELDYTDDTQNEFWGSNQPITYPERSCLNNRYSYCSGNGSYIDREGETPAQSIYSSIFAGEPEDEYLASPKVGPYDRAFKTELYYYTLGDNLYTALGLDEFRRVQLGGSFPGPPFLAMSCFGFHLRTGITLLEGGGGANYDNRQKTEDRVEYSGNYKKIDKYTEYIFVNPGLTHSSSTVNLPISLSVPGLYNNYSNTGKIVLVNHYVGYIRFPTSPKRRHLTTISVNATYKMPVFRYNEEIYGLLSYFEIFFFGLSVLLTEEFSGIDGNDNYPGVSVITLKQNWQSKEVDGVDYYINRPNMSTGSSIYSQVYFGWEYFNDEIIDELDEASIFKDNANITDLIYPKLAKYIYMIERIEKTSKTDIISTTPFRPSFGKYVLVIVDETKPYGLYVIETSISNSIMVFNLGYVQYYEDVEEGDPEKNYYLFTEEANLVAKWIDIAAVDYKALNMEAPSLANYTKYQGEPFGKYFII